MPAIRRRRPAASPRLRAATTRTFLLESGQFELFTEAGQHLTLESLESRLFTLDSRGSRVYWGEEIGDFMVFINEFVQLVMFNVCSVLLSLLIAKFEMAVMLVIVLW